MKTYYYRIVFCIAATSFSLATWGQQSKTFFEIRDEMNHYYENQPIDFDEDADWKKFKRWEAFVEQRTYPTGKFENPRATWEAYQQERKKMSASGVLKSGGDKSGGSWSYLGAGNFAGRVNCVVIDPNDTNTYWLGGSTSGVWKTSNGGGTWTDMSNNMPILDVADIVINPNNSKVIYVATGDNFGWEYYTTFYGYSMGVLKSTDGGNTWNPTGLSWNLPQGVTFRRLIMDDTTPNNLLAGTSKGIYRTTDGGTNWTLVKSGDVLDMEYHPTNKNIVYAVTDSIFKSTNGGASWSHVPGSPVFNSTINYKYRRVSIETTPAAPGHVYVLYSELGNGGMLYKSRDNGATYNQILCPTKTQVSNFLGYWTGVLEVSPVDTNKIIVGGTLNAVSLDGAKTWNKEYNNYVDQHCVAFLPNGYGYIGGNDGGVYRRNPGLISLNNGLQLIQFYRMGASPSDSNIIYSGRQDGGTLKYSGSVNNWSKVYSNDGTEALVDYTSNDTVYASYQYGNYAKSVDAGATFTPINPGAGAWTAPMVIHPTNHRILFYGGDEVRKSVDGGATWNDISTGLPRIYSLDVARSNPNYIYAATSWNSIYITTDGGANWTYSSSGLPSASISYISVSGTDPKTAWIVFSGFVAGEKVYKTTDAGQTWTNVSGSLPNIPVNCVEYDDYSTDQSVYIGTDIGVYYMDTTMSDWVYYSNGLPPVIVNELEIHYPSQKIRAATYGRGMWESPLNTVWATGVDRVDAKGTFTAFPNPTTGKLFIDIDLPTETDVHVHISNTLGQTVYNRELRTRFSRLELNLSAYPSGVYYITFWSGKLKETKKIMLSGNQ